MTKHLSEQPASPDASVPAGSPARRAAGVTARRPPQTMAHEEEPTAGHSGGREPREPPVTTGGRTAGARRPRRLGGRTRKGFLVLHIASAGAWIGMDVVMGVLVFTAKLTDDVRTAATCYQALRLFALWPLLTAGVVCLVSGVVLGLGGKYGLVRYWWVATKLVLNLSLSALVLIALRPGLDESAAYGERLAAGHTPAQAPGQLIYPPTVSSAALLIAVVLSVYKPWGRIRRRSAPAPRRAAPGGES
jgi:hypothetical protein